MDMYHPCVLLYIMRFVMCVFMQKLSYAGAGWYLQDRDKAFETEAGSYFRSYALASKAIWNLPATF